MTMTKQLTRERFDLFAIGTRLPMAKVMADELSYWADLDENVIGAVFQDVCDRDFGWTLLVRDRLGRFRAAEVEASIDSERLAAARLRLRIAEISRTADLAKLGIQGDETNAAVDLLTVLPGTQREQLHPFFVELLERLGRAPTRAVLREIGPWLTAADPHFVKEFQRHQFDQRLWELYLWAALREGGYEVTHGTAPDFCVTAPWGSFALEATTAAPSCNGVLAGRPDPETPDEIDEFNRTYMPMKYASALTTKLKRRSAAGKAYWEEDGVVGLPFVIAIADFHKPASETSPGSMTYTQSAISAYLFGIDSDWEMVDGKLVVTNHPVTHHHFGAKTIESGFFNLPGAENVAAVVFSNAGTIAKFDRMGVLAGYKPPGISYHRVGMRFNPDPNAVTGIPFIEEVGADGYQEGWADELQVFHNPRASCPLPMECFGFLNQHVFKNGQVVTHYGNTAVLASYTIIMQPQDERDDASHPPRQ